MENRLQQTKTQKNENDLFFSETQEEAMGVN